MARLKPNLLALLMGATVALSVAACGPKYNLADLEAAKQERQKQAGAAAAKRQAEEAFDKLGQE